MWLPLHTGDFMSLTFNTKTYANDVARSADSFRYLGPDHGNGYDDIVDLSRVAPRPVVGYNGSQRTTAKLTRSTTDGTVALKPAIIRVDSSIPADIATAELTALIADFQALVGATLWNTLLTTRKINQ